jgi:hypothetical protein
MILNSIKKTAAALALTATFAGSAMAQGGFGSDFSGPGGGGAAVIGNLLALGVPGGGLTKAQAAMQLSQQGVAGLNQARDAFLRATSGGVTVVNPTGGTVVVSEAASRAIAAVLAGNATPAALTALTDLLTGVPAGRATALVNALNTLGSAANYGNLAAAVRAYNYAVDGMPGNTMPSPALFGIRTSLVSASQH